MFFRGYSAVILSAGFGKKGNNTNEFWYGYGQSRIGKATGYQITFRRAGVYKGRYGRNRTGNL